MKKGCRWTRWTRFAANVLVVKVERYPSITTQRSNPSHGKQLHFLLTQKDFQLSNLANVFAHYTSPSNPSRHSASPLPVLSYSVVSGLAYQDEAVDAAYLQILLASPEDNNRNLSPKYGRVGQRNRKSWAQSRRHVLAMASGRTELGAPSSIVRHMHIICGHSIRAARGLEAERPPGPRTTKTFVSNMHRIRANLPATGLVPKSP